MCIYVYPYAVGPYPVHLLHVTCVWPPYPQHVNIHQFSAKMTPDEIVLANDNNNKKINNNGMYHDEYKYHHH